MLEETQQKIVHGEGWITPGGAALAKKKRLRKNRKWFVILLIFLCMQSDNVMFVFLKHENWFLVAIIIFVWMLVLTAVWITGKELVNFEADEKKKEQAMFGRHPNWLN
jgi:uncharacterized membrane protein